MVESDREGLRRAGRSGQTEPHHGCAAAQLNDARAFYCWRKRKDLLARKGDPSPVRRELRKELPARVRRQTSSEAARRVDNPDVVSIDERDRVA